MALSPWDYYIPVLPAPSPAHDLYEKYLSIAPACTTLDTAGRILP
jgi:hypothetical protein